MDPKLADKIWSQTVCDHFLSAILWPKKRPHFGGPKGIPIVAQESVHEPFFGLDSIQCPVCHNNGELTLMVCVIRWFRQTGEWVNARLKHNRSMNGFLDNNWHASWNQKWSRCLGHQIAIRKWLLTVCDQTVIVNFRLIKWHHNGPRKITFLNDIV